MSTHRKRRIGRLLALAARDRVGDGGLVIASDISEGQLACCPDLVRVAADGEALPFADKSFDRVLCGLGLMFFPDDQAALREIHRVLRPDGAFLLSLPHPVAHLTEPDDYERPVLSTPYPSAGTIRWRVAGEQGEVLLHPIAEVFTMLGRANFRVDTLAEPFPVPGSANSQHCHPARRWLPETVIFRGRKDGR